MRLLFSCLPAYGHAYPMVPLALAAVAAGHDVLFATGDPFRSNLVKQFGLETTPAGMTIREAFAAASDGGFDRSTTPPERQASLHAQAFGAILPRAFFDALVPVLDSWRPDLVVYEVTNVGAYFAARHAGTPSVCHGFGRVFSGDRPMTDQRIADFAAEVGLPCPGGFNRAGVDTYLDICPPSLQDPTFVADANRIPLRPVPAPQPGELPAWICERDRARPLVYLTLGTGFATTAVLRLAIDGLARLDCDVLVTTGPSADPAALGQVCGNVMIEPWVAQAQLLPHVRLVVHHGGSGTMLGSLAAGLPQLVLPQGADQFSNASALVEAGAGERLLATDLSAGAVADAAHQLLSNAKYTVRAGELAAEITAMPSPAATVPALAAIAEQKWI